MIEKINTMGLGEYRKRFVDPIQLKTLIDDLKKKDHSRFTIQEHF